MRISFKVSRSVFRGTDEEETFKATLESLGIPLRVTSFVKTPNALVVQVDAVSDETLLVKLLDELGYPVGIISGSLATSTRDAFSGNGGELTATHRVTSPQIDAPVRSASVEGIFENPDSRLSSGLVNPVDPAPQESTAKISPAAINNASKSPPPITRYPPPQKAPKHIIEKVAPRSPPAIAARSVSPPPVPQTSAAPLSPDTTGIHHFPTLANYDLKTSTTSERASPATVRPSRRDRVETPLLATQTQSVQVAPVFADDDGRAPEPTRSVPAATISPRVPRPVSREDAIHHEPPGYDEYASAEPNRRNIVIIASLIFACLAAAATYVFRVELKNFYDNYQASDAKSIPTATSRPELGNATPRATYDGQVGSQKIASVATQNRSKDVTRPEPKKTSQSSRSITSPSEKDAVKATSSTKERTGRAATDAVDSAEINPDPSVPKAATNTTPPAAATASTAAGGVDVPLRSISAELNRAKTQSFSEFRAQKLESDLGFRRGKIRESDYDIVEPIKLSLCVRPDGSVESVSLINGGGNSRRLLKLVEQWGKRTSWQWINGSVSGVQCGVSLTVV